MTNRSSGRVDRPQAVVGPITLSAQREGTSLTIPANSVVGPSALCTMLGTTTIVLVDATSTASGITVNVSCDGVPQTIDINGSGSDSETVSFPQGSELFAIARTADQIVLQSQNLADSSSVTFPIGTGIVTLSTSVIHEI